MITLIRALIITLLFCWLIRVSTRITVFLILCIVFCRSRILILILYSVCRRIWVVFLILCIVCRWIRIVWYRICIFFLISCTICWRITILNISIACLRIRLSIIFLRNFIRSWLNYFTLVWRRLGCLWVLVLFAFWVIGSRVFLGLWRILRLTILVLCFLILLDIMWLSIHLFFFTCRNLVFVFWLLRLLFRFFSIIGLWLKCVVYRYLLLLRFLLLLWCFSSRWLILIWWIFSRRSFIRFKIIYIIKCRLNNWFFFICITINDQWCIDIHLKFLANIDLKYWHCRPESFSCDCRVVFVTGACACFLWTCFGKLGSHFWCRETLPAIWT